MTLNYFPLVNRLVAFFNVQKKLGHVSFWSNDTVFTKPFITIAREPGSGGAPIAKAVADKLGFACLDDNLLDEMAGNSKQRKTLFKNLDEKTRSAIEDIVDGALNPEHVDDIKFVSEMSKVILSYAFKGKVVIVGRGANFITPFAKGLHINITAPYSVRVQRAMDYEGYSKEKAEEVLATIEKERKAFVKQYIKKDPTKINAYDLTINTTYFSLEQTRDLIVNAFYLKFPRTMKVVVPVPKVGVENVRRLFQHQQEQVKQA